DMDVVAGRGKLRRFSARGRLAEVSAIVDAARNRKAPLQWLQRQLGRCEDVPQYKAAIELGVASVAQIVGQPELAARVVAYGDDALELLLERRIAGLVDDAGDRLRAAEQVELAAYALPVIFGGRATGKLR